MALLLAAPAAARADVFDVPAGYFAGPTRAWNFSGCANGPVGYDVAARTPISGTAFCVQGRATFGQTVGGQYDLVFATALAPTPLAVAYGSTYAFTYDYSGGAFVYGAGCSTGLCSASNALASRTIGSFNGLYIQQFGLYGTLPNFDPALVAPTALYYATYARVPNYPGLSIDNVVTLQINSFSAVPEPSTVVLTLGGLAVVGGIAMRRRRVA